MRASTRRRIMRRDAAFAHAYAPLAREQDEAARLVSAATETGLPALLVGLAPAEAGFPARRLRSGEDPELAAVREGEPRRGRLRGAAC